MGEEDKVMFKILNLNYRKWDLLSLLLQENKWMSSLKISNWRLSLVEVPSVRYILQSSSKTKSSMPLNPLERMSCLSTIRSTILNWRRISCSLAIILSSLEWTICSNPNSVFTLLCLSLKEENFTRCFKSKRDSLRKLLSFMVLR